jgi:hypothetical protein
MNSVTHKTTRPMEALYSCRCVQLWELMHCLKSARPQFELFCLSMSASRRQTLPVSRNDVTRRRVYCCLIRHLLVRIRIAKCFTNSCKWFRWEVMFENEHTFCLWIRFSPVHSFCAAGTSIGLATTVTTIVSRWRLVQSVTWWWTRFWVHFYAVVHLCVTVFVAF